MFSDNKNDWPHLIHAFLDSLFKNGSNHFCFLFMRHKKILSLSLSVAILLSSQSDLYNSMINSSKLVPIKNNSCERSECLLSLKMTI